MSNYRVEKAESLESQAKRLVVLIRKSDGSRVALKDGTSEFTWAQARDLAATLDAAIATADAAELARIEAL